MVEAEGDFEPGDPVELAARYDAEGADEIVFLDITASSDERRRNGAGGDMAWTDAGSDDDRSMADYTGRDRVEFPDRATERVSEEALERPATPDPTPVFAGGTLYVMNRNTLYAIAE